MKRMLNRAGKALVMGCGLLIGLYITLLVLRAVLVLGLLMLPFLAFAFLLYLVGYGMPNFGEAGRRIHKAAETKARRGLDWLDFNAPHWTWPAISAARTFLDWLGIRVGVSKH